MFIATASACAVTMVRLLHSCQKYLQEPPLTLPSSRKYLHQPPVKLPASPFRPSSIYLNSPTSKYPLFPLAVSPLIINQNPSVTIIPPKAEHRSSRKVRICCRFGGQLMPRLRDGALQYVGGQTYITDFRRDTTLQELYYKIEDIYGGPAVIRYKLSDQNLDTLVSILSAEDLDNMLDEYDCLLEAPGGRYTRLEVFLFPPSNREISLAEFKYVACNDSVEGVNGANEADACRIYGEDNIEGSTRGDGKGNDNNSVLENQSFSSHSNIDEEKNVASYDMPYISPTYEPHQVHYITPSSFSMSPEDLPQNHQLCREKILKISNSNSILKNQDPWNIPGPSNNASYFGHFRLTQGTNEVDEDLQNLVELVESVLQSP